MKAEIRITVTSPKDCTPEEFIRWIEFSLGYRADIPMDNPIQDEPFQAETLDIQF